MEIVYLLVPMSVVLVFLIVAVFWWSVHTGQFDDLDRHGRTVVDDIDTAMPEDTGPVGADSPPAGDPAGPPAAAPASSAGAAAVASGHTGPQA